MEPSPDIYVHGHHESVLRSHTWRTAENSAAYLLPALRPGAELLDVGCGPGTITVDLARRVSPGSVVGIDPVDSVLVQARALAAERDTSNVRFEVGDVYRLAFADATFDVVHAHQVLQHLTDPVAALREMRRVTRPGGIVAARDADYGGMTWAPTDPLLDRWLALYHAITHARDVEADAGRHMLGWAHAAGFSDVDTSSATWTFATPELRQWWAQLWADRVRFSAYAEQAIELGLSDTAELSAVADAWLRWAAHPDAVFVVPHGEVIGHVGP